MANIINRQQTFSTNGTVTAAGLHNLIDTALVNSAIIKNQQEVTSIGTSDLLLIAPDSVDSSLAPRKVTVQNLIDDALTVGTFTNISITGSINYSNATGNSTFSTTGTIPNLTAGTTTSTVGTVTNLTAGTTNSTAANITNGTVQTLTASTATITGGTFSGSVNSTSGTIATLNSTTGTIGALNSTTGTIGTLNSTTGTIATLNSTTGTITNLSTTLAGDFTISQGTGTLGTAKVTPTNLSQPFTSATAVASTSGTAIDFTSIPSWAKRITVMFSGVSTNGTALPLIRIGSGGITTSGYSGTNSVIVASAVASANFTTGFLIGVSAGNWSATTAVHGSIVLTLQTGTTWVCAGIVGNGTGVGLYITGGSLTLGGILDQVRITTSNGTDTFDAGSINIMYEG